MATARTDQTAPVIRTPDQRLRVFVSSTLEELSEERAALRHAIEDLHLTPVMFELGASPHPPRALYRAYLEQSHVFVGIYWQRYGWVAPDMEVSGLEDEYLLSEGMPRLVYFKEPASEREEQMGELVKRIKGGGNSFRKFKDTDELAELLREDLAHLLTERFETTPEMMEPEVEVDERAALPVPVTRLVGRENDVEQILELLDWEDIRLLALTGVGGIGKSRLVLEAARRVEARGGREVLFVDLSPVTDPDAFPRALAASIGVIGNRGRPLIEGITERLRSKGTVLLVLDNFEQIVEAGRQVGEILAGAPQTRILVASRILLDIQGEHHWEVSPLPAPTSVEGRTVEDVADCPAVELFVERAQGADPRFVLTEGNVDEVSELCARLEGLPLALELTAAYVRFLPPSALLERFDKRLDLEAHADHPQRQRTLRATIDWSYGLLDDAERQLFARLAVFSGGWDLNAAMAVCGPDCTADVLQTLSNLVDKSLVSIDSRRHGEPRFRMLETVRVYAVEKLEESGERAAMELRHAEYFAGVCADAGSELQQHEWWFPTLDPDQQNLLVLGDRAQRDERLVEPLILAWSNVWVYAWARGLVSSVADVMRSIEGAVASLPEETRAGHAFLLGASLFLTGKPDESRRWTERALELSRVTGDDRLRGLALTLLGSSLPYETARAEADAALTEAVEIFRGLEFTLGVDLALAQLGVIRLRDGLIDEAIEMHRECLEIGRTLGARAMTAFALAELALDHLTKGELEVSRRLLVECAEYCALLEREGNREASAYCLEGLSGVALVRGDPELAAKLMGGSRRIRDVISTPVWALFTPLAEAFVAGLREQLGEQRFEVAAAAGAAMKTEDLFALGVAETAA